MSWSEIIGNWLGGPEAAGSGGQRRVLGMLLTGAARLETLSAEDQERVLEAASKHGVLGLLPGVESPKWNRVMLSLQPRAMRALRFTRRAVEALTAAKIPCVVLKGACVAARWREPLARQQTDLDLLVAPANLKTASAALISSGLASREVMAGEHMHNAALQATEQSGMLIELHHALSSSHELTVDVAQLLERRIEVATPQGPLPALALEDDAAYLAMHAATHAIERLAWLVDLQGIGAAGVDWVKAARRADAWKVSLPVELAWREARDLLAVPIPEAAFEALDTGSAQRRVAQAMYRATLATSGQAHRWIARAFRISLVPPRAWPQRAVHMFANRRETQAAFASEG